MLVYGSLAALTLGLSFKTDRIHNLPKVSYYLRLLMIFTSVWCTTMFLQVLTPVEFKGIVHAIGLSISLGTVNMWLYLALEYTGSDLHRKRRFRYINIIVYVALALFIATNPIHQLYFKTIIVEEPFVRLVEGRTLLFHAVIFGAYTVVLYGFIRLYKMYRHSSQNSTFIGSILAVVVFGPFVLEMLSLIYEDLFIFSIPYEPIGSAVFALSVLYYLNDKFADVGYTGSVEIISEFGFPMFTISNNRIIEANEEAQSILGDKEIPVDLNTLDDSLRSVFMEEDSNVFRYYDGLELKVYRVKSNNISVADRDVGTTYVFADITEEENQRNILDNQKEQLEQLANTSRHFIRNQVGVINGTIDMLNEQSYNSDDTELVERTNMASEKLSRISENISTMIRLSNPVIEKEVVALDEISPKYELEESNVDMKFSSDEIRVDREKSQKLLEEFLKYVEKTGATKAEVYTDGNTLVLRHNDRSNFIQEVTEAAFEHGEIQSKFINLNLMVAASDSHSWASTVEKEDNGDLAIKLHGVSTN